MFDHLVKSAHLSDSDIGICSGGKASEFGTEALGEASGDDDFSGPFFGDGLADGGD